MKGEIGNFMGPQPTILRVILTADTEMGTVGTVNVSTKKFVAGGASTTGKACVTVANGKAGDEVAAVFNGIVHVMSSAVAPVGQLCIFTADGKVAPAGATPTLGAIVGYYAEECANAAIDVAVYVGGAV